MSGCPGGSDDRAGQATGSYAAAICGGADAGRTHPAVVEILNGIGDHECTGTLVSPMHVLTAALAGSTAYLFGGRTTVSGEEFRSAPAVAIDPGTWRVNHAVH